MRGKRSIYGIYELLTRSQALRAAAADAERARAQFARRAEQAEEALSGEVRLVFLPPLCALMPRL